MVGRPCSIFLLVLPLVASCGRSQLIAPPLAECLSDPADPSAAGCSFLATAGVHAVEPLSEAAGLSPDDWEPDAMFVLNPGRGRLRLDVARIDDGDADVPNPERVTIESGERARIDLQSASRPGSTHRRMGGLLRIDGDAPFVATLHTPSRPFFGNDSALLLPLSALGRTYVIASYPALHNHFQGLGEPSFFEIVATRDDTEVRWRPLSAATAGDAERIDAVAAGEWSRPLVLDRHEAARITASVTDGFELGRDDLSGTVVEASAPIWLLSGTRCAAVPMSSDGYAGCDPLSEQLFPAELWGTVYPVPHPPLRTSEDHYYRIYAGKDGVSMTTDPPVLPSQPYVFERRGEFVDVVVEHGTSFVVDADGPVMPVGYLATRDEDIQIGDPAMYQHVPVERFLDRYDVTTGREWQREMLVVVRALGAADVVLDGEPVGDWETFAEYETTVVDVDEGVHSLRSDEPFGLTQMGWTNIVHDACIPLGQQGTCQTSYAHVAGLRTGR